MYKILGVEPLDDSLAPQAVYGGLGLENFVQWPSAVAKSVGFRTIVRWPGPEFCSPPGVQDFGVPVF